MKSISLFLISCVTAISLWAQTNNVTISLNTNRYQQVMVDGVVYPITTTTSTTNYRDLNGIVTISGLSAGSHTLEVMRTNSTRKNTRKFMLRSRYDLAITVNNDGSIDLKETRERNNTALQQTPMTNANFEALVQSIQNQRRAIARTKAVTNAISATNNYFTSLQASELLEYVNSESKRFSLAKKVYAKVIDPANFSVVYDQLEAQANRDALAKYVSDFNASHPNYSSYAAYARAMSDADFNTLLSNVKRQWFPGAKMSSLRDAFANTNYYFTVSQAMQLIQQVSSEANRLELAKSAYARIVDPSNATQLYDLFSSQSSKDELAAYISTYNGQQGVYNNSNLPASHTAMTDADFTNIYNNVRRQWLPGGKLVALRDVFANSNNYFTVYQTMQLIQLVSNEDNRLELAKSSYSHIVDPANVNLLYDLFTTQTRKDELRNYINSYSYNR
jgi:hypothetical protein